MFLGQPGADEGQEGLDVGLVLLPLRGVAAGRGLLDERPDGGDVDERLARPDTDTTGQVVYTADAYRGVDVLKIKDGGLTGKKVEIYSLPYSSINMWSSENAGRILDVNAEIELWTRAGHIKIKLGKGADVRRLDSLIGWAVLGN